MTITINGRKLLVGILAVVMIAAACYIAFLAGQATRVTEADATERANSAVEQAIEQAREEETAKRRAEVKATKAAGWKRQRARVMKLTRWWERKLKTATVTARQEGINSGYASGKNDGYASGKNDGFESGRETGLDEGFEEGLDEATDEIVCSDDSDVTWLPYC